MSALPAVAEIDCPSRRGIGLDEFLVARLTPPPGVGPVSLEDMDRAVAEGAIGRGSV